jgi:hypothetical protein
VRSRGKVPLRTAVPEGTLEQHIGQGFPTSDLVLLCSFGVASGGERTSRQLRFALQSAGFPGPVTRHLIRVSPLLRRSSPRGYRLREFRQ